MWYTIGFVVFNISVVGWLFLRRRLRYEYMKKRRQEYLEYCSKTSHTTNY